MQDERIIIKGAREHNLKDVDFELPRNQLIVFTGVSGSGKSSMAFDTLYAEGQRRYVESLSAYARQFLGQMERPDVDLIDGLLPAISIEQKTVSRNPRSTVATVTEIYDYMRVLFARVGLPHCVKCGREIGGQTTDEIIDKILELPEGSRIQILSPIAKEQKGEYKDDFTAARSLVMPVQELTEMYELTDKIKLDKRVRHNIEIVVDRIIIREGIRSRLAESVESALELGEGTIIINIIDKEDIMFSKNYACPVCGISYEELSPELFSFNSVQGMCPKCKGLGVNIRMDPDLIVPDKSKSINEFAIAILGNGLTLYHKHILESLGKHYGFTLDMPWSKLTDEQRNAIFYGTKGTRIKFTYKSHSGHSHTYWMPYKGLINEFERKLERTDNEWISQFINNVDCEDCNGSRLKPESVAVTFGDKSIVDVTRMSITDAINFMDTVEEVLTDTQKFIAGDLLKEISGRLGFLKNVGLEYLSLDRTMPTLSGGEAQRIRLASQIGSGLVGVLYILDEPTIGLHHRDNMRLLNALKKLKDIGNTVIVVEHDEDTMRSADLIVDFGPGPGIRGGKAVAIGTPYEISQNDDSITGKYLSKHLQIAIPENRRLTNDKWLEIIGARHNNLKNINVKIPIGTFTCITGVSGSGKSSLINDILHQVLAKELMGTHTRPGEHDRIDGIEYLDKIIDIDQSPIGRTPRSNPGTYIKVFDVIRDLFAQLPESQVRGYKVGRFSFNVKGGRCEACQGNGLNEIEMHFLANVWVKCEVCEGKRYNDETLQVKYKDKSISDVLDMDVQEALEHFKNIPRIAKAIKTLHDVGLDYIKLGQSAPTLSGGEAQRVKLAKELCRTSTGKTLYILDEPTTGMHFADTQKLLDVLNRLVDAGNTVVVIEHNMEVIKTADYIIDMGPEGGEQGGYIIAAGTPEELAQVENSYTGQVLQEVLNHKETGLVPVLSNTALPAHPLTHLSIRGAREHNLKGVDADIPLNMMTVLTGVSGSGKSSFALDTIYAEGQRRYVESLSSYARQFLGQMPKPHVDYISGLAPTIAIEQKPASISPRSTVGTVTDIYNYMRVLFARIGVPHCHKCGREISTQTSQQIVDRIMSQPEGTRAYVMAPVKLGKGDDYETIFKQALKNGYARGWIDGQMIDLKEHEEVDGAERHNVGIIFDRVTIDPENRSRLAEAVENALSDDYSDHRVLLEFFPLKDENANEEPTPFTRMFSEEFACVYCGISFNEITPQSFSFNNPDGMCPRCKGLGTVFTVDPKLVITDRRRSLRLGAIMPWGVILPNNPIHRYLKALADQYKFNLDKPFGDLPEDIQKIILYGSNKAIKIDNLSFRFKGVAGSLDWIYEHERYRRECSPFMGDAVCPVCVGSKLKPEAIAVTLDNKSIIDLVSMPIRLVKEFFDNVHLTERQIEIGAEVLKEIQSRLLFLSDVGLEYLTLGRNATTLSGGEAERIRLASQLGCGLAGVLYVLDEPSVGLHQRDNHRLLKALKNLRDIGNTVMIVEHDHDAIMSSDHMIDFGPGAGVKGGQIVAMGNPAELIAKNGTLTAQYLSGKKKIKSSRFRRPIGDKWLEVIGARQHNLKNINVRLPLSVFTCVTGVSGSGKSSLINDILYKSLARKLHRANTHPGEHDSIAGLKFIDKVINIDQTPLGDTPRSNPATYIEAFSDIRFLYSELPDARMLGLKPRRFSFNVQGGQCEACEGNGYKRILMHFLADVWVKCDVCNGTRYKKEVLEVKYKGKNISEVLDMTATEALEFFSNVPSVRNRFQVLCDVGLDYIQLGQSATTLSGGEAQRVKLAKELSRPSTGKTLYLLDEPTTGLHFDDIQKLLTVLNRLVDKGNTVVVIEHNLDVIKNADYIIDLGPEGGDAGGEVVACGTPEELALIESSYTGQFIRGVLS